MINRVNSICGVSSICGDFDGGWIEGPEVDAQCSISSVVAYQRHHMMVGPRRMEMEQTVTRTPQPLPIPAIRFPDPYTTGNAALDRGLKRAIELEEAFLSGYRK